MRCRVYIGIGALLLLGAGLTSCESNHDITACTRELGWDTNPSSKTVHVGESFTVFGEMTSCGGLERLRTDVSWTAADTTLLRVEYLGFGWLKPYSGTKITALKPGTGYATGQNKDEHTNLPFRVDVTVLP